MITLKCWISSIISNRFMCVILACDLWFMFYETHIRRMKTTTSERKRRVLRKGSSLSTSMKVRKMAAKAISNSSAMISIQIKLMMGCSRSNTVLLQSCRSNSKSFSNHSSRRKSRTRSKQMDWHNSWSKSHNNNKHICAVIALCLYF